MNHEVRGWPQTGSNAWARCPDRSDRSAPQAKNWKVDHWLIRLCTLPTTAPRQTSGKCRDQQQCNTRGACR